MSEPKSVRPPQATVAGWLVVGGSVVVVLMALSQGAVLHSLDTKEAVEDYLSRPPGDQLGLGVQGMLTLLRVVWTVTAVSGAAAAVLGWYALHRSKGARLALSGLAVPLFVTSFFFVRAARCQRLPGDGHRGDRDAVVPAVPGLVRRHQARSARAAATASAADRADRPGPVARPPAADRTAAAPHAVRRRPRVAPSRLAPSRRPATRVGRRGRACSRGCPRRRCSGCWAWSWS